MRIMLLLIVAENKNHELKIEKKGGLYFYFKFNLLHDAKTIAIAKNAGRDNSRTCISFISVLPFWKTLTL